MEEAAGWLAGLDTGSVAPDAFEAWRAADPRHAVAFAQVADAYQQVGRLRVMRDVQRSATSVPRFNRRMLLRGGGLAGVGALVGSVVAIQATARETSSTAVGERRTVTLEDGTRVYLNTATRISWRFADGAGTIWLEEGEIGIVVPQQARRALTLDGGSRSFRLGAGMFNARRHTETAGLLVLSGRATIPSSRRPEAVVTAGSIAQVVGATVSVKPADTIAIERARGWQNGQLVFEGESLDFVVAEFNRYLEHKIVVADSSLSRVRLGGRFTSTDPKDLLVALRASFGIKATRTQSGVIALTAI
ncbi:MAG: DUF4880 domain-containing protein [Sphingopyxis sp.]|nr:DUF4880 domain-containing protein [Sphingopyxis sp.]